MLELLFRGFFEWIYGLILECWEYFSSVLFDLMSLDFAYLETYMPIITTIRQIMLGVGWALLLGNLVFQATRSMMAGVGFEADDPKLLFTRTFVFSFLLVVSPQICDVCLNMTSVIICCLDESGSTEGECALSDGCQQELQASQAAHHFTVTGILLDKGRAGMGFSLEPFCQKIYRTSELTGDAVVQSVINLRV